MKKHFILTLISLVTIPLLSQLETAQWICGYQPYKVTTTLDTGINRAFGANILDFRKSPLGISRKFRTLSIEDCNISMCDNQGELLFFSNGAKIFNRYDSLIEGGDSLSPSRIWELGWNHSRGEEHYYSITFYSYIPGKQALIAIPRPNHPSQFYLLNFYMDPKSPTENILNIFTRVNYSILDMNLNNGRGKVILKEKTILKGIFSPILSACKHGDGKNWWITSADGRDKDKIYVFRATADSVYLIHSDARSKVKDFFMGAAFSPDGRYYATSGIDSGINLFQFNRCNGQLKFIKYLGRDIIDENNYTSLSFSPNSRFLYLAVGTSLYQYDLLVSNDSLDRIKLNKTDTNAIYQIQQAIDNKLYISTGSGTMNLHTIENPNEKGLACNFKINSIALKTWNRGIPQFPNYALSADTCYTNSIKDEPKQDFVIYPNPAHDKITIQFEENLRKNTSLYITDILGRVVFHQNLKPSIKEFEISTIDYSNGSYNIYLYDNMTYKHKILLVRP